MKRKILTFLLAAIMSVQMLPGAAYATEVKSADMAETELLQEEQNTGEQSLEAQEQAGQESVKTDEKAVLQESESLSVLDAGQAEIKETEEKKESVQETAAPETQAPETENRNTVKTIKKTVAAPEEPKDLYNYSERLIPDGYYYIKPASTTGLCLDVQGGSSKAGANIQLYRHHGSAAQIFHIVYDTEHYYYKIRNARSDLPITLQSADSDNVYQAEEKSNDLAQAWGVSQNPDKSYTFWNIQNKAPLTANGDLTGPCNIITDSKEYDAQKASFVLDDRLCLTSASISVSDQAYTGLAVKPTVKVTLCGRTLKEGTDYSVSYSNNVNPGIATVTLVGKGSYRGTASKTFKITAGQTIKNGIYFIKCAKAQSMVLDIKGGSMVNKGNLQVYKWNKTQAQMFIVTWLGGGDYRITNVKSDLVLDVAAGSLANMANVQQYKSNNTDAQKFRIVKNSDGTYSIINKKSGKAIDVKDTKYVNGNNVQQYTAKQNPAQKFIFENVSGTTSYVRRNVGGMWYKYDPKTGKDVTGSGSVRIAMVDSAGQYGRIKSALEAQGASVTVFTKDTVDASKFDGLVLPGGADVTPSMYGEGYNGARSCNASLDRLQIAAINKFVKAGKPVLGICRGSQILNVALGGTLYQDISGHRSVYTKTNISGGLMKYMYGSTLSGCRCTHHQCVKKLASGLTVTQKSADGRVEAYENLAKPIYGIQWHPENSGDMGKTVFKTFVQVCRAWK